MPVQIPMHRRLIAAVAICGSVVLSTYFLVTTTGPLDSWISFVGLLSPYLVSLVCTIWLSRMYKSVRGLIFAVFMLGCALAILAMGIQLRSRQASHFRETMANLYAGFEADQLEKAKLDNARAKGESNANLAALHHKSAVEYRSLAGQYHRMSEAYKQATGTTPLPPDTAPSP